MRNIEIIAADWCLGMCGSIEFTVRPGFASYRIRHTMADGMMLQKWDGKSWSKAERAREGDILDLIKRGRHNWTWPEFEVAWEAFAEGYTRAKHSPSICQT